MISSVNCATKPEFRTTRGNKKFSFLPELKNLRKGQIHAETLAEPGCPFQPLSPTEVVDTEPAFENIRDQIASGLYYPGDESGDAHIFTQKLVDLCKAQGVKFKFKTTVDMLITKKGDVTGVETDKGVLATDAVILALGSYSPALTRRLDLNIPIQPVKGCSITLPVAQDQSAPEISLIDNERKLVFSRFGDRLRVARMAETSGFDTSVNRPRTASFLKTAIELFPDLDGTNDPEY